VPVAGMAGWLQVVARNNPVTHWCNLARYLSIGDAVLYDKSGTPITTPQELITLSVVWIVALLAIFVPLAIRLYRRLT
jgi:hypothetical protein